MIEELRIEDLGVISEAALHPHPGLTVVTGETGAGKTMIVTGLGLLLGGRADPHMVRTGAERAKVEGRFGRVGEGVAARVEQAGGELDEGDLLVVRTLAATGRSRTHVGGTQTPNGVCAEVVGELVAIHGQSE
jgi:DNA repair protein RecN (Recombination protein N)